MSLFKSKTNEASEELANKVSELALLQGQFDELNKENESLKELVEEAGDYKEQLNAAQEELKQSQAVVAGLQESLEAAEKAVEDFDGAVSAKVESITADLGVKPVKVVEDKETKEESLLERFANMDGDERAKFWEENREQLLKGLNA